MYAYDRLCIQYGQPVRVLPVRFGTDILQYSYCCTGISGFNSITNTNHNAANQPSPTNPNHNSETAKTNLCLTQYAARPRQGSAPHAF